MAQAAGVSYVTMWKAVRRLAAQGVVRARRRSGVWAASPQSPARRPEATPVRRPGESLTRAIARRLRADIAAGAYRPGDPLPSVKETAATLGVCPRTVHAAFRLALEEGTVARDRRRWLVPLPDLRSPRLRLLVIAPRYRPGPMLPPATYSQQVHHQIEAECGRRGIAVTMVEVDAAGTASDQGRNRPAPRDLAASGVLAGCVVLSDGLAAESLQSVLGSLRPPATPIAVLANTDELPAVGQAVRGLAQVRLFTVGNDYAAGRQMGDYLVRLGHRRIAYVCLFHYRRWSEERLAGLRNAFEGLGQDAQVHALLSTHGDEGPVMDRRSRSSLMAALRTLPAGRPGASDNAQFRDDAVRRVEDGLLAQHRRTLAASLVRQALRRRDLTAWVAGNDLTALVCLDHLTARGVHPPRGLSLAAFDDTYAMSVHRVTTYHFDVAAAARAILGFALSQGGPERRAAGAAGPVEPQGRVISRDTVAAV